MQRGQIAKRLMWLLGIIVIVLLVGGFILTRQTSLQNNNGNDTILSESKPLGIKIANLTDGETISGLFTLKAIITDISRVVKVEYYADGAFNGVSYEPPFQFSIDSSQFSNGEHELLLKLYSTEDTVIESQAVTVVVKNQPSDESASETSTSRVPLNRSATSMRVFQPIGGSVSTDNGQTPQNPIGNDTQAPSSPTVMVSAQDGYTTDVSWTASSDNVGVTSYKVLRDGTQIGTSNSLQFKDQTVVPGNTYDYEVKALDAASNESSPSNQPTITLTATSVWIDGDAPSNSFSEGVPLEVGMRFKPKVDGMVSGVRFYKPAGSSAGHTGSLWEYDGSPLASLSFSNQTASGWQEAFFDEPVSVTAGTTYVVSYFMPNAYYGYTSDYFYVANGGISSQYLEAGGNTGSLYNGLYKYGGGFPNTISGSATNYWADVSFIPNPSAGGPTVKMVDSSKTYLGYPGTNNTGVPVGKRLPARDRRIDVWQDNITIENIEVQTEINVFADNVVVKNTRVAPSTGAVWGIRQNSGSNNLVVEDTEIYGTPTQQMQYGVRGDGTNLVGRRLNISCYANGIQANEQVLIEDSIIHSPCYFAGDHTDAFITTGGHDIILQRNTFHNNLSQTSAIGLFCDFSAITDTTVTDNLLIGGGYAVYAGSDGLGNCAGSGNNVFINNKFSREAWPNGGLNGPVTRYTALPGNVWSGNTWHEDGTPVNP